MSLDRRELVKQLFHAALERQPGERMAFLEEMCLGDTDLYRELLSLIANHRDDSFLEPAPLEEQTSDLVLETPNSASSAPHVGNERAPLAGQEAVWSCRACGIYYDHKSAGCPACGAPLSLELEGPLLIDGKYALERHLGHGGMGVVYRARHLGLQRAFALKLIRAGQGTRGFFERFRVEAEALGRLKHPGIVDITDFGVDPRGGGTPYLVMELLEGESLQDRCRAGPLPAEEALRILEAIAQAIDFAHERGVLHRDLKPGNVLLSAEGIKVLDFGLARVLEGPASTDAGPTSLSARPAWLGTAHDLSDISGSEEEQETTPEPTTTLRKTRAAEREPGGWPLSPPHAERVTEPGGIAGTPAYMAPEVLRGEDATRASDLYSFGVLAYELLAGRRPFPGGNQQVITGHLFGKPDHPSALRPSIPNDVDMPLLAGLAKEPALRPARAGDLVASLRASLQRGQLRLWRVREIPFRLVLALLAGLLMAPAAGRFARSEIGESLERPLVDARFALLPARPPDPRLALVVLDEASLAADPTPLVDRGDEFGKRLQAAFGAGVRAVAIDALLPSDWGQAQEFSRLILRHADALTLSIAATPAGELVGRECLGDLTALALGAERSAALFGLTNVEEDKDGVIRRGRLSVATEGGSRRETWAARAAYTLVGRLPSMPSSDDVFWLDPTVALSRIPTISWKDLPDRMESDRNALRDRLLLVGGDFTGSGDTHRLPASRGESVSGVQVQSVILHTILAGFPYQDPPAVWAYACSAFVTSLLLAAVVCVVRGSNAFLIVSGAVVAYLFFSLVILRTHGCMVPVTGPLVGGVLGVVLGILGRLALPPPPSGEKDV